MQQGWMAATKLDRPLLARHSLATSAGRGACSQKSPWSHIARRRSSRRRASSAAALHCARQALPPSPPSGSACIAALQMWGKGGGVSPSVGVGGKGRVPHACTVREG